MLNFTRALLKLRREHPALANAADFQPLYAETNKYPFVYLRVAGTERIIVAINPAERSCTATVGSTRRLGGRVYTKHKCPSLACPLSKRS
jgi:glycosidase